MPLTISTHGHRDGSRYGYMPIDHQTPRSLKGWHLYIQELGLEELGAGSARIAYALNETQVIKVARDEYYVYQCNEEWAMWEASTPEVRQYLATIYDAGEGWCIMERATGTVDQLDLGHVKRDIISDLCEAAHIADGHGGNVGYFGNGRFKILDYGLRN